MPDTPAGDQLAWVIDGAAGATDEVMAAHFSADFLAQVSAVVLRQTISGLGVITVEEILASEPTQLAVQVSPTVGGPQIVSIQVGATGAHLIEGLLAQPAPGPAPTSWSEVKDRTARWAPDASLLVAEVTADGQLHETMSLDRDLAEPLGSAFKLYVLGALTEAIEAGMVAWTDELAIEPQLKSLPSGELQDRPDGSTVTVLEAATKMISISDNTAADMIASRLGRAAIEAVLPQMGMTDSSIARNLPWLTTRELFSLKWGVDHEVLDRYRRAGREERQAILDDLGTDALARAATTLDPSSPVEIETVEWFASPNELAAAHVWLDERAGHAGLGELRTVLGTNPGVRLDPSVWKRFSFKGGSEPGVFTVSWLLEHQDGRRFVVVLEAHDTAAPLDEGEGAAIAQGIIDLAAP